jgi:hypothetical protein
MSTTPVLKEIGQHPALYAGYAERLAAMADELESWHRETSAIDMMSASQVTTYGATVRQLRRLADQMKRRADTAARQAQRLAAPEAVTRVHMWPIGGPITGTSRCTECGITWADHYSKPDCTPGR